MNFRRWGIYLYCNGKPWKIYPPGFWTQNGATKFAADTADAWSGPNQRISYQVFKQI